MPYEPSSHVGNHKMKVPQNIKNGIRVVLIIAILLLNWIFIVFFISGNDYDDIVYKNGGYLYSILALVLIAIQGALKQKTIHLDLEKIPKENEVNISDSDQWSILFYSVIKTNYLFMLFGLFEIGLYFVIQSMTTRNIGELLFFGFVFLIFSPLIEIVRFSILKSKQGYPKLKMSYLISDNKIEVKTDEADKIINFDDIELTQEYKNMIFIKTKIVPEYLIFNIDDK